MFQFLHIFLFSDPKYIKHGDAILLMNRQRQYGNESFALSMRNFHSANTRRMDANFNSLPDYFHNSGKFMTYLEETTDWMLLCLPIKRNSFLYEPLNKFVLEFYQHGLFAHSESKWNPAYLGPDEEDGPQVLTMRMLSAGFIIWMICIICCLVVFFIEIIAIKCQLTCNCSNKRRKDGS